MLHLAKTLQSFDIHAADGDIGTIYDFYFDDEKWTIRYFVIDTRKWLPGRKVLLSPIAFDYVNEKDQEINILASKETIKNSPEIDTHKPVSRKHEIEISNYYGWRYYWTGPSLWGNHTVPSQLDATLNKGQQIPSQELNEHEEHLRSIHEVTGKLTGYDVKASDSDDDVGKLYDFLINEETWKIEYLIIASNDWINKDYFVIPADWMENVNWTEKDASLSVGSDKLQDVPLYDPSQIITKDFETYLEEKLHNYS